MPTSGSKALKLGWQVACLCLLGIFVPALVTSLGYSLTDALGPGPGFFALAQPHRPVISPRSWCK